MARGAPPRRAERQSAAGAPLGRLEEAPISVETVCTGPRSGGLLSPKRRVAAHPEHVEQILVRDALRVEANLRNHTRDVPWPSRPATRVNKPPHGALAVRQRCFAAGGAAAQLERLPKLSERLSSPARLRRVLFSQRTLPCDSGWLREKNALCDANSNLQRSRNNHVCTPCAKTRCRRPTVTAAVRILTYSREERNRTFRPSHVTDSCEDTFSQGSEGALRAPEAARAERGDSFSSLVRLRLVEDGRAHR